MEINGLFWNPREGYYKHYTTSVDWNTCQSWKNANSNLLYDLQSRFNFFFYKSFDYYNEIKSKGIINIDNSIDLENLPTKIDSDDEDIKLNFIEFYEIKTNYDFIIFIFNFYFDKYKDIPSVQACVSRDKNR